MPKRKGFDPIADAHELSQHNFHASYWFNRVTSYTYAQWMALKKISVLVLPLYVLIWVMLIKSAVERSREGGLGFWAAVFDFSNADSLARLVQLLFLAFYTVVMLIGAVQLALGPRRNRDSEERPKREMEKKHPKRRKDYGR
jgi:hypothetical protein